MTMPDEQQEAKDSMAADEQRRTRAMEVTIENTVSATEINRSVVGFNVARARLRLTLAEVLAVGCVLAVAWTAWAMVHWA